MNNIKRRTKQILKLDKKTALNFAVVFMLLYFIFHSIYGNRGIIAYFKLQAELESSNKKLEQLRAERLEIENRTKLLRPGSLDRDMLDEKIRSILGYSSPKEKIFKVDPDAEIEEEIEK